MNDDILTPINIRDRFSFSCSPEVPCFNECCRDLNQFLTPYDVLRLKQGLELTSTQFLEQFCGRLAGPESGLPAVTLKPADPVDLVCPFVTSAGCRVYPHRPSSCRMYPLMRGAVRSRLTGEISERFMLLREPHCLGCNTARYLSPEEWMAAQELGPYNEMNDRMLEIISLKNRLPAPLDLKTDRFFFMACYDLDTFRRHVLTGRLLQDLQIGDHDLEKASVDDVALLKIGMAAVKDMLLKIPIN